MLADPHAQNVLVPVHGNSQHHIRRLGHIAVILLDLVVNGVHEHEGIDRFQGTVLPGGYFRHNLLTDLAHQFRGYLHIVQALDLFCNIPLAHTAGVQGQNLVFHALGIAVILGNDFRLVVTLPVSGNLDVDLSQLGLNGFLRVTVAVIGRGGFTVGTLTAFPAQFLVHLHLHDLLDDVPEQFFHGRHDIGGAGEMLALDIPFQ